ncbi:hypothetical protein C7S16_4646 [Burkholderia thailandensis]|uniref:Uncharacterized protein n=1 Tax=Burkholderia thailandensis TaxID=57975 RepID=A0AAW9CVG0_BURTH|nr:hypothetical protein [Burkholderia thailandensis]
MNPNTTTLRSRINFANQTAFIYRHSIMTQTATTPIRCRFRLDSIPASNKINQMTRLMTDSMRTAAA